MKLDTRAFRYLTAEDWRVLQAVEQGSKNHELVPTPLIQQIAGLRGGSGVHRCISTLAKAGLIAKVKNAKYDGYRLTYGGLDYLALNTHRKSSLLYSLGNQIGVGKESDIYITASPSGRQLVLKLHRLGRISFRSVKANRDYLRHRTTGSWMYLSRLAAQKEYAFMRVLWREGFAVPEPVGWSRHTVLMEFVDAFPLRMIERVPEPGGLHAELMGMIVSLAQRGLIHGDFNEFNILIKEEEVVGKEGEMKLRPILIDFPQTVSTNHVNAKMYFERDVACVKRYFERRFKYVADEEGPLFEDAVRGVEAERRLDVEVEASGFSKKMAKELERYVEVVGGDDDDDQAAAAGQSDDSAQDDDEEGEFDEGEDASEVEGEGDQDAQHDDAELAEQLASWRTGDDLAVKPLRNADYGLLPLDLQEDTGTFTPEKVAAKKKATGWAI
ncbi:hypothetical protein BAUCODRAFT_79372 [Baudoinia panamericana UAMH 10762]|uniref:Serine/threonine-protein kinase RIO2 n=1 Tax=Baudoinia panamericana (strain UAMH 10762) TaxID=717646 RepID=M2M5B3_BAUPA|nr:uncharacterized protein BAUCODRAFT_79372 [Baudoinia panamericana UAMH 10762]EMC91816.1 hypothetical protein BAUCODRAFT_79372 [Baudoinia panamericana UAMH 10762]